MGSGSWSYSTFRDYTTTKGIALTASGTACIDSLQDNFKARSVDPALAPLNIMRECCDTDEHPTTIPVILCVDVTGSMGQAAVRTASVLNNIMEDALAKVKDIEFCIMGIGDLAYDHAPIQMSQFESDIRIAEHLDKVYFEFGGGGNSYESYTAAWYMGAYHTKLDCWKRGKKGIIITMGDENLNPYLPKDQLSVVTGDTLQADVDTDDLYKEVSQKYDIYHIHVGHGYDHYNESSEKTFTSVLPKENYFVSTIDALPDTIVGIITGSTTKQNASSEGFSW